MSLYKHPPAGTHVLCLDEWGPIGVKHYVGKQWSPQGCYPTFTPDYGGHGYWWTFGAFAPHSGEALTYTASRRTQTEFIQFLDQVVAHWSTGQLILILDNLSVHKTLNVRLWALMHPRVRFLFQPTYAPWLNLIEPWWKTLRDLAVTGRTFTDLTQIAMAIQQATNYWNNHRHPYRWQKPA